MRPGAKIFRNWKTTNATQAFEAQDIGRGRFYGAAPRANSGNDTYRFRIGSLTLHGRACQAHTITRSRWPEGVYLKAWCRFQGRIACLQPNTCPPDYCVALECLFAPIARTSECSGIPRLWGVR
jgi:hypothetical protein